MSDGSVHVAKAGVNVDGGPGSVTGGEVQVTPVDRAKPKLETVPIGAVGAGVDVSLTPGARIALPLTLTFEAKAPHKNWVPAVAHQRADRSWELREVTWDGQQATLSTEQFSSNVLVWFDPSKVASWVGDQMVDLLTGRKPGPECPGNAHSWSVLEDHEDLVHACLTKNDSKTVGERAELRLSPNRGAYVEVTVPKNVDYVWVKDQTAAFRQGMAKVMGGNPGRTVYLGPKDEMTIGWRKLPAGEEAEPTVRVEASLPAMWLTLFEGTLDFDGFAVKGERSAGLMIIGRCATKLGYDIFKSTSGALDALGCLRDEAIGNLSDPKTALGAASDFLGPSATKGELETQTKRLTSLSTKLSAAGHLIKIVSVIGAVRTALLATYGTVADQLQTAVLDGDGTSIIVKLRTPVPVSLAKFAGEWVGHTRSLQIDSDGRADERVGNGCCDPVVDLRYTLSRPRFYQGTYIATATITGVTIHDQETLDQKLRIGQTANLTLSNGVISAPFVKTNYCNDAASRRGVCGA